MTQAKIELEDKGGLWPAFVLLGLWVAFVLAPDSALLDQKRAFGFTWAAAALVWLAARVWAGKPLVVPSRRFAMACAGFGLAFAVAWLASSYQQAAQFRLEVLGLGLVGALLATTLPDSFSERWPFWTLGAALAVAGYALLQRTGWEAVATLRATGTFGNAGFLAAFLCAAWPLALLWHHALRPAAILLMVLGLLATQSRAGALAFAAQLIVLGWQAWREGLRPNWAWLGAGLLGLGVGSLWLFPFAEWQRPTLRLQLWSESLELALRQPFLGWGPGSYSMAMLEHQSGALDKALGSGQFAEHPHNLLLSLFHEAGLLGLAAGAALLALCKPWPRRASLRDPAQRAVALGLLGLLLENLFDRNLDGAALGLTFFFGLGFLDRVNGSAPGFRAPRWAAAALFVIALACAYTGLRPVLGYQAAVSSVGLPSPEDETVERADLKDLQAATKARPRDVAAWDRLAEALAQGQAYAAAADAYVEAWALQPSASRAQNLGNCYIMLDQPRDAERSFRAAVALAPNSSDAHFSLGYALFFQKRLKEAVAELDLALKIDPNNFGAAKLKEQILR